MKRLALMPFVHRIGVLAALTLAACTIRVEQPEPEQSSEAECLELFQTCIELAGESPGCTEVYQFCIGSVMSAGTDGGGAGAIDGCEQRYIDCLEDGGTPETCQPLLDMCTPDPTTSTTGQCVPGEPDCPLGDTGGSEGTSGCSPDEPGCMPVDDCEAAFLECVDRGYDESACIELQNACETGSCETAWGVCLDWIGDPTECSDLTGCSDPNSINCMQILSDCEAQGYSQQECAEQWPERPECFPGAGECTWYEMECQGQFVEWFCADAQEACQQGLISEVFECSFFDEACGSGQFSDMTCTNATDACVNGFDGTDNCNQTPLFEDPYQWLMELADCNGWN